MAAVLDTDDEFLRPGSVARPVSPHPPLASAPAASAPTASDGSPAMSAGPPLEVSSPASDEGGSELAESDVTGSDVTGSAAGCVGVLRELLAGSVQWWRASDDALLGLLREVDAVGRMAAAVLLEVIGELDRRGVALARGCSSTAALLREVLRLAPNEAQERERLARAVTEELTPDGARRPPALPATAQAMQAGEVHLGHVRVIARALAALPPTVEPQVRESAEAFLAEQARVLDPHRLGVVAGHLRAHLDPDGMLADERAAVADRELYFSQDRHGRVVFKGRLDAEGAAILRTALDPLAAPRPSTAEGPDERSPARRHADALVELAGRCLDAGRLPSTGGQRPHLTVTVDLHRLRRQIGAAHLDWGGPITAATARRIACDARVTPVVLGSQGEPLDVGRAAYTVPAPQRRALVARDGGCAFPGCDRPPGWCDAHHVVHWADGGPTAITNLVLLCGAHHRVIHHGHWQARITAGRPEFIPPPWVDPTGTPRRNTTPHDLQHLATPA